MRTYNAKPCSLCRQPCSWQRFVWSLNATECRIHRQLRDWTPSENVYNRDNHRAHHQGVLLVLNKVWGRASVVSGSEWICWNRKTYNLDNSEDRTWAGFLVECLDRRLRVAFWNVDLAMKANIKIIRRSTATTRTCRGISDWFLRRATLRCLLI